MSIDGKQRRESKRTRSTRNSKQKRDALAAKRTLRKMACRPIPEG